MRIGGMASGMDTEQMVRDLMRAERMRLDRFFQQEQRIQWRQQAFASVNRSMAKFILDTRQSFGITDVSDNGYFRPSAVNGFDWVKRANSSDESVVKTTATANAMAGAHRVEVEQLAEVASVTSEDLKDMLDESGNFKEEHFESSFKIETASGQKTITIGNDKEGGEVRSIRDLVTAINSATNESGESLGLRAAYDSDLGQLMITSRNTGGDQLIKLEGDILADKFSTSNGVLGEKIETDVDGNISASGAFKIKVGEDEIVVAVVEDEPTTLDEIIEKINNDPNNRDSDGNLKVKASEDNGRLKIQLDGATSFEILEENGGDFAKEVLKLPTDSEGKIVNNTTFGQDAKIKFNGSAVEKSNNNFSVFGINLELQSAKPGEEIHINVDSDVNGIYDKVEEFVNQYNALLDEVNGQLGQKYYRDFPPLTDEQKESMSDKDIEKWEEKAQSGHLRNDPTLTRTLQNTRTSLYQTVDGVSGDFDHLTQIGITTGNYQSGGKLVINEQKLRDAIAQDAEGVMDLLFKIPPADSEGEIREKQTGLVQRVYGNLMKGMEETVRLAGPGEDSDVLVTVKGSMLREFRTTHSSRSVLDRDLLNLNTRIAREEDLMARREDRYWQQFTAMEKALSKMYQQSDWLMAQMGQQF
ncbi:MAG: flagellar filament capping protein FliD [Clostridiaceae bacterium]|nr:flagellar filament capping protein FliD [Clostridiaceae bacterium]